MNNEQSHKEIILEARICKKTIICISCPWCGNIISQFEKPKHIHYYNDVMKCDKCGKKSILIN